MTVLKARGHKKVARLSLGFLIELSIQHSNENKGRANYEKRTSGPEVKKLFSCSTQLSMIFFLLIYVKMPTIVGILTCMSGKNIILGLTEPKKTPTFLILFILMSIYNFILS